MKPNKEKDNLRDLETQLDNNNKIYIDDKKESKESNTYS